MKTCKHCGSDKGFYTKVIMIQDYNCDGEPIGLEPCGNETKYATCYSCGKKILLSELQKGEKRMKTIPKKYIFTGSPETGRCRNVSPIGKELRKKELNELECPCCGEKALSQHGFDDDYYGSDIQHFIIECDNCSWVSPTGDLTDCGETISELKCWLEAYYLLGKPKDKIKEDLTLYFYPENKQTL